MTDAASLLELPFDQYQRYKTAADLLTLLGVLPGSRVIDVGGAPGRVEDFLPDHETYVIDVEGPFHGRFVLGSGAGLPFGPSSFAAAIALDTLEHVPVEHRGAFLAELRRVADVVIVSAPFSNEQVELAERALGEFVLHRFGEFPTLDEHAAHGLPRLEEVVQEFEKDDWPVATLPSGYLPRWLAGMLLHHELLASGLPELSQLHAYYNATVSPLDCREPSYRHVVAAARDIPRPVLDSTVAGLRVDDDTAEGEAALRSIVSAVFAQRLGGIFRSGETSALHSDLDAVTQRAAGLELELADRDAHLIEARGEIERLRAEITMLQRRLTSRLIAGVTRRLDRRNQ
jgi:hypothetical protein